MEVLKRKRRVDYSQLVTHLQFHRTREANDLLKEVIPKLVHYLKVTMRADEVSACESVHQAYIAVHERIMENKIKDPKLILGYMMQASRNAYLNLKASERRYHCRVHLEDEMIESALQIEVLMEEERMEILQLCISELDEDSREFISYYLENPGIGARQVAHYFSISEANARTKKFRITAHLHDKYHQKLKIVTAA